MLASLKHKLKSILFGQLGEHRVKYGLGKGLKLTIDPLHKSQRILGLDEREVQPYFAAFAKCADVFIDVGASDGYYSLIYRKLNQYGQVICCDADQSFRDMQHRHFFSNFGHIDKFQAIEKLVGDHLQEGCTTIDELIRGSEWARPFIKVDVDGGELQVLKGAVQTLTWKNCVLIIETHSSVLESDCILFLKNHGYDSGIIRNAWWRTIIPEKRMIPHNRWFYSSKNG